MVTTLIAGIVNVLVNYIAIRLIGTMGAVVGTVVAYLLTTIIRMTDMKNYIEIDINYVKIIINWALLFIFAFSVTISNKDNMLVSGLFFVLYFIFNFNDVIMFFKSNPKVSEK